MHFPASFLVLLPLLTTSYAAAVAPQALPKANEYRSSDCSGGINYGHHNANLVDVTMDETSHSVYLAGGQWVSFTQKTGNGGSCHGDMVAVLGGCNNLDQDVRIACVRRTDA